MSTGTKPRPPRDWRPRVPQRVSAYFNERKLLKRIVQVGLASFAVGYLAIMLLFFPGFGRSPIVTVPDLRGQTQAQAARMLDRAGLEMERGTALSHPRVQRGRVLAQVPLPGQEASRGSSVRVLLSSGPELRKVPSVAGLNERDAIALLQRMGFEVRLRRVQDMAPEGRILSLTPAAGQQVAVPGPVIITLSAGPPRIVAPSVVTLPLEEARTRLQAAGLRLGRVTYDPSSAEPLGGIASQAPAAGDSIRMGGAISVVVSGTDPNPPAPADTTAVPADSTAPAEAVEEPAEPEPEPAEPPEQPGAGEAAGASRPELR